VCFVFFIVCLYMCICECLLLNNNHQTKHKNNTNCGSAFELGASVLPYYCTSICVRSWCNWRASSVDLKKTKEQSALTSGASYPNSCGACHCMWYFLCPPPPADSVQYAQRSWLNTCMLAHTQHRFLVLSNKTTLVVAGTCAHGSASGLNGGCAHALLSMWIHAYFCDMQRTLSTD